MPRIMRDQRKTYLNIDNALELIGKGVTDFTIASNPKNESVHYVHDKNPSGGLSGYAPTATFTAEAYSEDPVMEFLVELGRTLSIGVEAHSHIVTVDTWEKNTDGKIRAIKQNVVITIDNPGSGAGGSALAVTGSMTYDGDPIQGTYDEATKTFTAV